MVQFLALLGTLSNLVADLHKFLEPAIVVEVEEIVLEWQFEERGNIVPIVFDHFISFFVVVVPKLFHLIGEDVELLVVDVLF